MDLSIINDKVADIPDLREDQDERVTLLVLRKGADTPQISEDQGKQAASDVYNLVTSLGFDPEQSYLVTFGVDNTPGNSPASGVISELKPADPTPPPGDGS